MSWNFPLFFQNNGHLTEVEQTLGMTIDEAVAIWRNEGAPVIHVASGINVFDFKEFVQDNPNADHLVTITEWLQKRKDNAK